MTKQELEKEIASLEIKCKELRNKNMDLQTEAHRLHKTKVDLQTSINALIEDINSKNRDRKKVSDELGAVKKESETRVLEAKVAEDKAKQAEESLLEKIAENEKILEQIKRERVEIARFNSQSKDMRRSIIADQARIDGANAQIERKNKELDALKDVLQEQNETAVLNIQNYNALKEKLVASIAKANEAVSRASVKDKLANIRLAEIENKKVELIKEAKHNEEDRIANDARNQKNLAEEKRIEEKERAVDARMSNLDTKEKEIEIKRLRLEKISREQDLDKRLKQLREEAPVQ